MNKNTLVYLLIILPTIWTFAQKGFPNKIDPQLRELMETGNQIEALVILGQDGTLISVPDDWQKESKAGYVYIQLKQNASSTQKNLAKWLTDKGISFKRLYIVDAIWIKADSKTIKSISKRKEVKYIRANPIIWAEKTQLSKRIDLRNPEGIEWGIEKIGADKVWDMGFRGKGVVVGGNDTGVNWEHFIIQTKYRGYDLDSSKIDHNFNWHDAISEISPLHMDSIITPDTNPCGLQLQYPCDDDSHGTWTMGTMIGSDEIDMIGVAPEAEWIACRCMERGYGSLYNYLECLQWFLAPTDLNGENADPFKAPHVINNSWACIEEEGCSPENFQLLGEAVHNLVQSGIVVVASAGNNGKNGCKSIFYPLAIYPESFTVGATDSLDSIADFSSRGPVGIDSSFRLKPEVVAPGVDIRSASLDQGFRIASGTSGSGPHVAGTIALMISANPGLAGRVDLIQQILKETAIALQDTIGCNGTEGNSIPNNTFGYGRIDAYEAVMAAMEVKTSQQNVSGIKNKLLVYPNPFQDHLWFKILPRTFITSIEIWDINGKPRIKQMISGTSVQYPYELATNHLNAGIYIYQIVLADGIITGKIIKM